VSLRDARIRTKLTAVLLIPVISTVGLAAAVLTDSGRRASDARDATRLAAVAQKVTALSDALHHERMTAAGYATKTITNTTVLKSFFTETDTRIAEYEAARAKVTDPPGGLGERYVKIDADLQALPGIRLAATTPDATAVTLMNRYGAILRDLDNYIVDTSSWYGSGTLAVQARGLAAYAAARSSAAEQQAAAYAALTAPGGVPTELHEAFVGTFASQRVATKTFTELATKDQVQITADMVSGDAPAKAAQAVTAVTLSVGNDLRISADQANHDLGAQVDLMRQAQVRLESDFATAADAELTAAYNVFNIQSAILAVVFLAAIAMGIFVGRLMIRSLERLRSGALAVAHRSLRLTVDKLSDARGLDERTADALVREMGEDIGVVGEDEIGEVAQAFHVVHREAVRIAADQAVLRATVSAMFLSLARRSQTLVDRMIAELDAIERHEQDPQRLAEMFRLDHLATRMRRNDENLLVLAGADASPARRDDAGLEDVLRAAQSEVELYDRVEFSAIDHDTLVASHAVNDVVRMTAELMDNATRFSPPGTLVLADARRINDYVLIQVEDRGLGMTDEQLMSVNERLETPGAVDVSAFRMMGLGVVSRLAARYGIKAELLRNADSGITASLTLPRAILILPRVDSGVRGRHLAIGGESGRHALPPGPPTGLARSGLPSRIPGQQMTGQPMSVPPMPVSAAPVSAAPTYFPPAQPFTPASPFPAAPPPPAPPPPPPPAADDTREMPIFREISASWFGSTLTDEPTGGTPSVAVDPAPPSRVTGRAAVPQDTVRSDWPSAGSPPPMAPLPVTPPAVAQSHASQPQVARPPVAQPSVPVPPAPPPMPAPPPPAAAEPPPVPRQRLSAVDVVANSVGSGPPTEESWRTTADTGWQAAAAAAKPVVSDTTRSGLPIRTPQANLVPGSVSENAPARVRRTPEQVQGLLSAYTRGVQRGRDDLQTTAQNEDSR
jgi:signal transduction histidine kinase